MKGRQSLNCCYGEGFREYIDRKARQINPPQEAPRRSVMPEKARNLDKSYTEGFNVIFSARDGAI